RQRGWKEADTELRKAGLDVRRCTGMLGRTTTVIIPGALKQGKAGCRSAQALTRATSTPGVCLASVSQSSRVTARVGLAIISMVLPIACARVSAASPPEASTGLAM